VPAGRPARQRAPGGSILRALIASKALIVGAYQRKLDEIAAHDDVELIAVVPPSWREGGFERRIERPQDARYEFVVSPIAANGNFHLFFFPELPRLLDRYRPDVLHFDEEAYNFSTFMAVRQARARRIPSLFFTWQNINRRYPLPFRLMERYVYATAACALAGTPSAERVLREKGYRGPVSVFPQFGVDPNLFMPEPGIREQGRSFTIGFAGRLVPEKGVELLVDACAALSLDFRLRIMGEGPALQSIEARARLRGVSDRLEIPGPVRSTEMPAHLRQLDALVLPSLTRPNWSEQFGRILVEAMACGVPVVGSDSGEIPDVVGDAGLVVPEGDVPAITRALECLANDAELRASLARRGRERVLERYTHRQIAEQTVATYRRWARR
jgi:glycosyltransferase involved in cell wall biosynthesis